ENNKNFILAIALSVAVLVGWQMFYMRPAAEKARQQQQAIEAQKAAGQAAGVESTAPKAPGEASAVSTAPLSAAFETREAAIAATPRVKIDSPDLIGSINLKGGRIDDVVLRNYTVTVDPNSPKVVLLSPSGSPTPYYTFTGWLATEPGVVAPGDNTVW